MCCGHSRDEKDNVGLFYIYFEKLQKVFRLVLDSSLRSLLILESTKRGRDYREATAIRSFSYV